MTNYLSKQDPKYSLPKLYQTKDYNSLDNKLADYSIKPLQSRPIAKYDNTTYALAGNSYNMGKRVG